ncbi:MAG: hypothetical protein WCR77_00550 [Bacilli bacterium]|jgi:hypothetical protein|nr:hypothetical protein [Bacilli bacterium]
MISDVFLTGRLSEPLNETIRLVEIDRMIPEQGKFVVDKIPVLYWSKEPRSRFMKLTTGSLVVIRGRLQFEATIGLIIVAEQLAILGQNRLNELRG